jgi:Kef-type K+ transport system membrane component KefB
MMLAGLHMPIASLVDISSPKGAPWEFLVIFATLLIGPLVVQRARIPGIIGLLLGGYVIGPHGLGLIGSGNSTLPDLGQLGLLYLMFVAGVELDLNLLRRYRRSTVVFGLLTFSFPMAAGTIVGLALGWEVEAAILLGSLLASHTLLAYPAVRDAGQASDPSVATVVGSTVLTDTLALIVLAGVAGSAGGNRSAIEVAVQLIVGLSVLIGFSLLVLPALAAWAFRYLGAQRSVRYVVAITAFLSAATVAELFGIEGIVGAFFAGLALNRLVPNEGQLMDRIGFFGGAVFIPVFLVSVGLILNPAVMVEGETLKLAAFFILACLGGKALAATLSARLLGFSRPQAGLLFALSTAQAAATLAATVIGFQLGLFDSSVVNAVLVLILVSVIVSTVVATRASARLTSAEHGPRPLGTRVVVGMRDPDHARGALLIAVRIARADGGVVYPVLVVPDTAPVASKATRARFEKVVAAAGVDGLPSTIVDGSLQHGAIHAGAVAEATLVLVAEHEPSNEGTMPKDASPEPAHGPVALVSGNVQRLGIVRMLGDLGPERDGRAAEEIARRVAGGAAARVDQDDDGISEHLDPQDVTFASAQAAEELVALPESERGIVITMLDQSAPHEGRTVAASEQAPG